MFPITEYIYYFVYGIWYVYTALPSDLVVQELKWTIQRSPRGHEKNRRLSQSEAKSYRYMWVSGDREQNGT